MNVLIYGYGNPGRTDDGLGPALAAEVERWLPSAGLAGVATDADYQLNLETSADLHGRDVVLFADATKEAGVADIAVTPVAPSTEAAFCLHSVSPGFVLNMCRRIYGAAPPVFLLRIRGYAWEIGEGLTVEAQRNLAAAFDFVRGWLAAGGGVDDLRQAANGNAYGGRVTA